MAKEVKQARDKIIIKGARVNNLKNIDIEIPRDELVVVTGLSGSGKSSLAFDVIYAEGNRRYLEGMSSYARQFLDASSKPEVDKIENLSPTISIDQKSIGKSLRSTVGTLTDIYDYLRILFLSLENHSDVANIFLIVFFVNLAFVGSRTKSDLKIQATLFCFFPS